MPSSTMAGDAGPPWERSVLMPLTVGAMLRGSTASEGAPVTEGLSGRVSRSWGRSQKTRRRKVPDAREAWAPEPRTA